MLRRVALTLWGYLVGGLLLELTVLWLSSGLILGLADLGWLVVRLGVVLLSVIIKWLTLGSADLPYWLIDWSGFFYFWKVIIRVEV